jgi:hypothetical protein
VCDAGPVTVHRMRFEGPRHLAVRVATRLADVDGVDLVASQPPQVLGPDAVALEVEVEGDRAVLSDALAAIRDDLPPGASIDFVDG